MLAWLRQMPGAPRQTFMVHGEPDAADALRLRIKGSSIKNQFRWSLRVPHRLEAVKF